MSKNAFGKEKFIQAIELVQEGLDLLKGGIQDLLGGVDTPTTTVETKAAVVQTPATKEKKTTKKVEAKPTTKDDFDLDTDDNEPVAAVEVSEDVLRQKLVEYANREGNTKEKAFELLGKYGAKKVADLKKADYVKVYNDLTQAEF